MLSIVVLEKTKSLAGFQLLSLKFTDLEVLMYESTLEGQPGVAMWTNSYHDTPPMRITNLGILLHELYNQTLRP
jgi:hypothetical protein